jgi:hypothetical protein
MSMQSIDAALDRLYLALNGYARDRRGNAEAAAMVVALALAAMAFGFELTNPTLGVDDFTYLDMAFAWDPFWIGRGSWGGLLVQYLTPGGWMTPFVSLVIGILLQLLTAVLIGWALGVRALPPLQQALLYALFVAFPYFACQMAFNYVQIAYPLASLLMAGGVLLALAGDFGRSVCAAIGIAFAISIYQGSLSVLAPVALLAPLAVPEPRGSEIVGRYRRVLVAALAGGALYFAAHKAILAITGIVAQNPYYSVSFDWRFWERLASIRGETVFLLLGASDVIPAKAVVIWELAALVLLLHVVGRQDDILQRLRWLGLCVLLGFLAAISPFLVLFFHAGQLAPRSSVGVAVVWFALFAFMVAASSAGIRRAGTACLAAAVVFFVFQDNRMFFSQHLVTQADTIMMARIAERIDRLALRDDAAPTNVVVIGQYTHPQYAGMPHFTGDVLGYSQFEWATVETRWYMRGLARAIGVDHYVWRDAAELGEDFRNPALLQGRQPWPHASSVFAHGGYAVVWLGQRREDIRVSPVQTWYKSLTRARKGG